MNEQEQRALDRELIRDHLVTVLARVAPMGLPAATLAAGLRQAGWPLDNQTIAAELDYLAGKGLILPHVSAVSAALQRWHITAAGREYVEAAGLEGLR
jgi:hypothetical protein